MLCKIIAGILVMMGTMGFGMSFCQDMKYRLYHLIQQKHMLLYFVKEIDFLHRPLIELFEEVTERLDKSYAVLLKSIVADAQNNSGKSIKNIWNENVDHFIKVEGMKKDNFRCLYRIGDCLGCDEDELQISMLMIVDNELDEEIGILKGKVKEQTKLIKTLSFLAGIFCIVMFM